MLFCDDDASLAGDHFCVDDGDVCACLGGNGGGEALDEGGEEGFSVCEGGEVAFVDEVECGGGFGELLWGKDGVAMVLWGGVVLGVKRAHFLDEADEWLKGFVFFREDQRRVNGATGEVAVKNRKDLLADVEADVFLCFDGGSS